MEDKIIPEKDEKCVKGIHWGQFKLKENEFNLNYDNKEIFSIPYDQIINSYCVQKKEVNLELNNDGKNQLYPYFFEFLESIF